MSRHFRSFSQSSNNGSIHGQNPETPLFKSPATMDVTSFSPNLPQPNDATTINKGVNQIVNNASTLPSGRPASHGGPMPDAETSFPKDTPPEMIPILTLLNAQQSRNYTDGYFMILSDLNTGMLFLFFFIFKF